MCLSVFGWVRVCGMGDDVSTLRERDEGGGGDGGRWWKMVERRERQGCEGRGII